VTRLFQLRPHQDSVQAHGNTEEEEEEEEEEENGRTSHTRSLRVSASRIILIRYIQFVARNSSNALSADFSLNYQVTIVDRHIGS
jgi:Ca2+/H+ antiporter